MAERRRTFHESSIHDFKEKVKECEMRGECGRTFIRVEKLKAWVSKEIDRLLDTAYHISGQSRSQPALPIGKLQISGDGNSNCALLIFCLLLEMDQGKLIHHFHHSGRNDWLLGQLDSGTLKGWLESWKLASADFNIEEFAKDFARRQWRYCPVKFELEDERNWYPQQIVPIHKKLVINNKGFTASVCQIEVLEEFVGHSMRKVISASRYKDDGDGLGYRYTIALKTFKEGNRQFFTDELKAFQALNGNVGLIQYLGSFTHRDHHTGKDTYNILLEFGDRDLDEFFFDKELLPPVFPAEIRKFWEEIFAVADGVKQIHSFKKLREGVNREFYGWHADIKPDNILRVRERFKLADPGFACFEQSEGEARLGKREQTTDLRGCTTTYGAPECHPGRKKRSPVPRSIDIWSLGCVFSVSATWVVLGDQGILQFQQVRERAVREKIEQAKRTQSENALVTLEPSDFFHDGETILKDVLDWHKHLRNSRRRTDTVTSGLLDLVDKYMLCGEAEDRISAERLWVLLQQLLKTAQQEPTESLPASLQKALVQIDISAPAAPTRVSNLSAPKSAALRDDIAEDRKTRKSRLLEVTLIKTVHRSELLPAMPEESAPAMPPLGEIFDRTAQTPLHAPAISGTAALIQRPRAPANNPKHTLDRPGHSTTLPLLKEAPTLQSSPMTRENLPSSAEQRKQNMWQVHEEKKGSKHWRESWTGKYRKDAEVSEYFGDRDIAFLIDNADSMAEHWAEAIYLLEALAMKASGQDEDGMDLYFTHGNLSKKGMKKAGTLIEKMRDPEARAFAGRGRKTDIRANLMTRFFHYLADVKTHGKKVRKLVVIIFTDGKWDGMSNKHAIEDTIVEFVENLKKAQSGYLDGRQVSFEFVQFGDDEDARHRLQRLDDEMIFRDIPDLIDTEESRGDVNKMLVGSFDPAYDSKNDFKPIPSNSMGNVDGYFDGDTILPSDQQSQSPPQMDRSPPHNAAFHQRVDSGHAQSLRKSPIYDESTPFIHLPQFSRGNSQTYSHHRQ